MNLRYIVATEVFRSNTCYGVLDEARSYLSLAEGGTKTVLATHHNKLEAIAEAKHDHEVGNHSEAHGSLWRRVGKSGCLYSLVRPCLPLCEYVPEDSEELLKKAVAMERARLEYNVRDLQSKIDNLAKL